MLCKVTSGEALEKLRPLFSDLRFAIGKTVLDGMAGEAWLLTPERTDAAFLTVKRYCFFAGNIPEDVLKEALEGQFRACIWIPSAELIPVVERLFEGRLTKNRRFALRRDLPPSMEKCRFYGDREIPGLTVRLIDPALAERSKTEKFLPLTENYAERGIGVAALDGEKIVGVMSSGIVYRDGIELNLKVDKDYRGKGIATVLSARMLLECQKRGIHAGWDAANETSLHLAEKMGLELAHPYEVYQLTE
ncbi:MAG: GNAT family N-acetyltransferase [Lachnospiraceae bacterium]|nr:GNAT family N-acetyltransferase [Lachnospiraceae bacterium]